MVCSMLCLLVDTPCETECGSVLGNSGPGGSTSPVKHSTLKQVELSKVPPSKNDSTLLAGRGSAEKMM